MKKHIIVLCLLMTAVYFGVDAQSRVTFRQAFQTPHVINPAFSGINPYWSVHANYGQVGVGDGLTNSTFQVAANLSFSSAEGWKRRSGRTDRQAFMKRHGLSLSLGQQRFGEIVRTMPQLSYGVHIPLSRKMMLAAGAGGLYFTERVDVQQLYVRDPQDPDYIEFLNNDGKRKEYGLRVGVALYASNYYVGYALSRRLVATGYELQRERDLDEHIISAGYRQALNEDFQWLSSTVLRIDDEADFQPSFSSQIQYRRTFRAGLLYSHDEALTFLTGLTYKDKYRIDMTLSRPMKTEYNFTQNKSMVEVALSIFFKRRSGQQRHFW
ncbi:hypothetical protein FUAX_50480 (plasmid) [Fulvitalea axinellae]|uniref:Type IX secretion system membrane protein PorP/SprF n=1 Tax=Fulvitalea axinellae TaxID=1182444 RepID=A0AAU9CUA6_9BACT|nr:hypothetical protein FUAX_50480 [Fulvitalea axinellae]